jgi:hypothetical protein
MAALFFGSSSCNFSLNVSFFSSFGGAGFGFYTIGLQSSFNLFHVF